MAFATLFTTSQWAGGSAYGFLMDMRDLGSSTGGTKRWLCICEPTAGGDSAGIQDS
jgi:hypothetical protein